MNAKWDTVRKAMRSATPLLGLALAACTGGIDEELRSYTEEVLTRKAEPLPPPDPPKPYVVYTYQGQGPDPFEPFFNESEEEPVADDSHSEFAPEEGHVQEELELFPLDALRMVGTLEQDAEIWGIVLDREGTVYRVQVGNYMGQNFGKIIAILEDRIELEERARDNNGKWFLREASIALAE